MIGVIADDFTGATDVAVAFHRAGASAAVLFGLPGDEVRPDDADVVVVALKTRTIDPALAVEQSLAAARWLAARGADRFYFKFCSTFDSRPEGNIGPVADALADFCGATRAVVVPASPEHRRTQYNGHLFVGEQLLSESPMRNHPLTPMTDSAVPRLLEPQTRRRVELVPYDVVRRGTDAVREALDALGDEPVLVVVDALTDDDLYVIARAVADDALATGAAGLAGGLGAVLRDERAATDAAAVEPRPAFRRPAVLAGSCSARTLEQVAYLTARTPSFFLDALAVPDAADLARSALDWYDTLPDGAVPFVFSSVEPERLRRIQAELGTERASAILEGAVGLIARGLVERGVDALVVAGGETSGAVVSAVGVPGGRIGREEAPGVPWISALGQPLSLLLKSGNFGAPELLAVASGVEESDD